MTDQEEIVQKLTDAAKAVGYGTVPSYEHHECFTTGVFDLILVDTSDPARVFGLLQTVCARYDSVKHDRAFLNGYIYLVCELARLSGTTEMPIAIEGIVKDNPLLTRKLQEWYRITSSGSPGS